MGRGGVASWRREALDERQRAHLERGGATHLGGGSFAEWLRSQAPGGRIQPTPLLALSAAGPGASCLTSLGLSFPICQLGDCDVGGRCLSLPRMLHLFPPPTRLLAPPLCRRVETGPFSLSLSLWCQAGRKLLGFSNPSPFRMGQTCSAVPEMMVPDAHTCWRRVGLSPPLLPGPSESFHYALLRALHRGPGGQPLPFAGPLFPHL